MSVPQAPLSTVVVCLCGRKQSGKNTAANYIVGRFLVETGQVQQFDISDDGHLKYLRAEGGAWADVAEGALGEHRFSGVALYSFADALKWFCMDVFGLTYAQCYGSGEDKNTLTQLRWEQMPTFQDRNGVTVLDLLDRKRCMSAREVLQYFGTDVVREMYSDAWAAATMARIGRDRSALAIITDGRFPNEVAVANDNGGRTLRLLRNACSSDAHASETALDDLPDETFTHVLDNRQMTIAEQNRAMEGMVTEWLEELRNVS